MVLNRKIIRTISEYKSRYIGSVLLVVLSCAMFTSFNITGSSVRDSVESFRAENVLEDANFALQKPIDDIKDIESRFDVILEERKAIDYKFSGKATLRVVSEPHKINRYQVIKGQSIESDNEIIISEDFAKAHKLEIGKPVSVLGREYKIAGYATMPDYLYLLQSENDLIPSPEGFGLAVVSPESIKNDNHGNISYSIKFGKDNVKAFKEYLNKSNYYIINWTSREDNTRISAFDGDINGFIQMGRILPVVVLILTCFLIAVVLSRLLKGEFVQIGTLYALGYKKSTILGHYLIYPVIISILGGIAGTITGILLSKPLVVTQRVQYSLPVIHYNLNIWNLLISLILPFVFLISTTVFVVLRALRLPPLVLMRGGADKTKVGFLERSINLNRLNFNAKFKLRELLRNIPRALLMVFGVTFASMLLLFGFVSNNSIDGIVDDSYNKVYKYEYTYIFKSFQKDKIFDGEVFSISPFTVSDSDGFDVYGMEEGAKLIELKDSKGKVLSFDNTIITKSLAKKLGVSEKDTITLKNKLNDKEFSITIDKISTANVGNYIYMPLQDFNDLSGYPEGSYTGVFSESEISIDKELLASSLRKKDIIDGYNGIIKPMRYMVLIVAALAFLISIIVIYIVTSMVIEENKTNISLLKILGYGKKRIFSLVLNSNTILVIAGYILSVPLIIVAVDKLFEALTSQMDVTIPARIDSVFILIGFILMFAAYEFTKFIIRGKVIGISMADSLKSRVE